MPKIRRFRKFSIPNYLHERPLASASIEFAVKYLFPRPKIEFAFCNSHDDFAAHGLAFQMGISVVLAVVIVGAGGDGGKPVRVARVFPAWRR